MAKVKGGKLRFIYGLFLGAFTLFVGVLFVLQTWRLFNSAPQNAYTKENIGKFFQEIALFVWIWLGGVGVNILLSLVFPKDERIPKVRKSAKEKLENVKKALPTDDESLLKVYSVSKRKKGARVFVGILCTLVMLAAIAACVVTLLDIFYIPIFKKPFFAAHHGVVDRITQCSIVAFAALTLGCVFAGIFAASRKCEGKQYKKIIREAKEKESAEKEAPVEAEAPVAPVETTEEKAEPAVAEVTEEAPEEILEAIPVEEKSRWLDVIYHYIAMKFLGDDRTQAEIDEELQAVAEGRVWVRKPKPPVTKEEIKAAKKAAKKAKKLAKKQAKREKKLAKKEKRAAKKAAKKEKKLLKKQAKQEKKLAKRQVKAEKKAVKLAKKQVKQKAKAKKLIEKAKAKKKRSKSKKVWTWIFRVALLGGGVTLIVLGVVNGGMKEVLEKAINICTQCIGLG